jgi:hypothetical protein
MAGAYAEPYANYEGVELMEYITNQLCFSKDGLSMSWACVAGFLAFNWLVTRIVRVFKK